MSRRALLRLGAAAGAAVVLGGLPGAALAAEPRGQSEAARRRAETDERIRTGRTSANGWPIEKGVDIGGAIWSRPVVGCDLTVALHIGAVQSVLHHLIRRYSYEIHPLEGSDVVGYQPTRSSVKGYKANHGSGTAIDIRPGWYPAGSSDGYGRHEVAVLRSILDDCAGVVAWGGDLPVSDEAHFAISVPPGDPRLADVHGKLELWERTPGLGAGTLGPVA